MPSSMEPQTHHRVRVGIPFRTAKEEAENKRTAYDAHLRAIRDAGGEPVEISLVLSTGDLECLAESLDAFVLPGSPADVDPARYSTPRHRETADPDPLREQTDFTLLDVAFARNKPVLAICYGVQLLNVYLGGTLVQDISSELEAPLQHEWSDRRAKEPVHQVRIEAGSRLAGLAGGLEARVNSSHHQSVLRPGRDLGVVASAPDGVIEAVEGTGKDHWVIGVQWHPERMAGDAFSAALFRELIAVAGHR